MFKNVHTAALFILLVAVILTWGIVIALYTFADLCPMTGYIDSKTVHPQYYPANHTTPLVYALGITSEDGRRATTWIVDEETYNAYTLGDEVRRWQK